VKVVIKAENSALECVLSVRVRAEYWNQSLWTDLWQCPCFLARQTSSEFVPQFCACSTWSWCSACVTGLCRVRIFCVQWYVCVTEWTFWNSVFFSAKWTKNPWQMYYCRLELIKSAAIINCCPQVFMFIFFCIQCWLNIYSA